MEFVEANAYMHACLAEKSPCANFQSNWEKQRCFTAYCEFRLMSLSLIKLGISDCTQTCFTPYPFMLTTFLSHAQNILDSGSEQSLIRFRTALKPAQSSSSDIFQPYLGHSSNGFCSFPVLTLDRRDWFFKEKLMQSTIDTSAYVWVVCPHSLLLNMTKEAVLMLDWIHNDYYVLDMIVVRPTNELVLGNALQGKS